MAMPEDRDKIIHQVPENFDAQEKGVPFYPGPESKEKFESKQFKKMPVNIPTEWLPAYKFACAH